MRWSVMVTATSTALLLILSMDAMTAHAYLTTGRRFQLRDRPTQDVLDDYNDNLARLLFYTRKRSCIRRGGSCDHRPHECCFSSSCRCNLWGTNCRCQRVGLFQKWGK